MSEHAYYREESQLEEMSRKEFDNYRDIEIEKDSKQCNKRVILGTICSVVSAAAALYAGTNPGPDVGSIGLALASGITGLSFLADAADYYFNGKKEERAYLANPAGAARENYDIVLTE